MEKRKWRIDRTITGFDTFGKDMPNLNLQGETKVNTLCGGIVTLLIASVVVAFATHKAFELV